jgi:GAF domain
VARVRARALAGCQRAARAAAIAERHESLAAGSSEVLRGLHQKIAAMHRQIEHRHGEAAAMHSEYADRLAAWFGRPAQRGRRPVFMASVARTLGSDSAAMMLLGSELDEILAAASDGLARQAQDLEFAFREGPARDAAIGRAPVTADDGVFRDRWTYYGPALARLGVHAVAAVPLQLAQGAFGALTAFSTERARELDVAALGAVADTLAHAILAEPEWATSSQDLPPAGIFEDADLRPVVHQAAGMLCVQADCTITDAFALIRARAFTDDEPLEATAARIVSGLLHLG